MKGICWNSRGLRDLAKHDFLHNISLEKDLNFIATLEANKNNFLDECLVNFCGGKEFLWH
jgi:hypothetical protein